MLYYTPYGHGYGSQAGDVPAEEEEEEAGSSEATRVRHVTYLTRSLRL